MRTVWIGAAVLAVILASIGLQSQSAHPLVGVWKVAEIVSPKGEKDSNPQPTIYIFTTRHYSHVSVTSTKPRPNYTGQTLPTRNDWKCGSRSVQLPERTTWARTNSRLGRW
jgi:hypothetical protein